MLVGIGWMNFTALIPSTNESLNTLLQKFGFFEEITARFPYDLGIDYRTLQSTEESECNVMPCVNCDRGVARQRIEPDIGIDKALSGYWLLPD